MDSWMPVKDGLQTTRERKAGPRAHECQRPHTETSATTVDCAAAFSMLALMAHLRAS